jgi:hypothetical protein
LSGRTTPRPKAKVATNDLPRGIVGKCNQQGRICVLPSDAMFVDGGSGVWRAQGRAHAGAQRNS